MGASAGPDVIDTGLVLALDAADRNSYPGSGIFWADLSSIPSIGKIGGKVNENSSLTLTAPSGSVITNIDFASYGTPTGTYPNFSIGGCHATNSLNVVNGLALGKTSVTITANNSTFGDPCAGTVKSLAVVATTKSSYAILTNGPTYSSANGGSIVFDGSNDYVSLGNILDIGTGQFSIECIARVSSLSTGNYSKVASKGVYNQNGWRLQMGKTPSNDYNLVFEYDTTSSISILGGIQTNTWYHFLVCRDGNNLMSTYLNGELRNTSTVTSNLTNASYNYIIGNNGSLSEPFNGNVACYRHYNRALTAAEVQQNFNALRGRFNI